ncbi:helix-turn-helix transcriptional regulator [Mariniflexile litorale]|uniref:Helix-turn-helix transcriptional regulator n=1 Tax=Mariniflexile litorale TaxID=3045158 RepID=A0AAU7EKQ9_9FLAO|nr:helix-turn-helix transcriptional regulator [Mariniflexile sp. KMM 9835]MDQ8213277.1 helix-turn-helix transcriptional regulator [Mariniflexile sp. KMM 9835]
MRSLKLRITTKFTSLQKLSLFYLLSFQTTLQAHKHFAYSMRYEVENFAQHTSKSRIEKGQINTSVSTAKILADALEVEVYELFKFED